MNTVLVLIPILLTAAVIVVVAAMVSARRKLGSADASAAGLRQEIGKSSAETAMLRAILDKTDDGMLVVDQEARIQMTNLAAIRLLNAEPDSVHGRTIIECTLNHDLSNLVGRVLKTGTPASLPVQFPQDVHLNIYAAPIERTGALVVMHDISPAMRIDAVRRDFVANVSHEFRTPLASIKAMAETIALRGRKNPDTMEEFAQKIMAEVDRLTVLSEDLLDLARIEAGRRPVRMEQFSVRDLVERVLCDCGSRSEVKAIDLATDVPEALQAHADRDAVYQILVNLVDNAIRYTRPGGRVEVSAVGDKDSVAMKVSDTGIGIPAEELPRIFERFYRVDKARSRESGGTGLGLSIVKHLVDAHSGRIDVQSTPGEGTTFTVTLPTVH